MSTQIRQIQLKRTEKGINDDSIKDLILNEGEPLVNFSKGYIAVGDGENAISNLNTVPLTNVSIPKLTQSEFGYTGSVISPTLCDYCAAFCQLSGNVSAQNVGSYSITVSLLKDNSGKPYCKWEDNTIVDKILEWKIVDKLPITVKSAEKSNTSDKLSAARTINGVSFDGSQNIANYATCPTSSSEIIKSANINSTFIVSTGASVKVLMQQANTAANPSLKVGTTQEYRLVKPDETSYSSWSAGTILDVVFNGTSYVVTNSIDAATNSSAGIVKLSDSEYDTSKTSAATPYVVDLKCHCYVQTNYPTGKVNKGDLFINSANGLMAYYDGSAWKHVRTSWA